MSSMGSSCSMHHRQREEGMSGQNGTRRGAPRNNAASPTTPAPRRSLRHSVNSVVPDDSIASLYPLEENYIDLGAGRRSPKSLSDLATDALCRALPHLDGALPPGLPQDAVDAIVDSLIKHSALNATTLRVLRNCELGTLTLSGCRGVTDEWLEPLSHRKATLESMDIDLDHKIYGTFDSEEQSACSSNSFVSAASHPYADAAEDQTMVDCLECKSPWVPTITSNLTLLDLRGSQSLTDRGLLQLTDLTRLEVAKLDNCHALVGKGLLALQGSHSLHTLSLANCRRLTDEAVVHIAHLQSLEALSLDGCRCVTDCSLAALADLYGIRKLGLSQCDLITDAGLEQLSNLEALEELSLGWCRQITDRGIDALTLQPNRASVLRILRLARCPVTDQGIGHLARLVALEELDLNGCSRVGSTALGRTLGQLVNLRVLDVSYCPGILRAGFQGRIDNLRSLELGYAGVQDAHLGKLTHLPALEDLNLDSCPVGDWSISHLADNEVVPNLKSLDLADTDLTDVGMTKIAKFTKLTRLSLFYCNISNHGLRHLARLEQLETLNLDSREISDEGLRHLRPLKSLRSLDIFSGRITDTGCSYIAAISSLENLELCGGVVGDMGCTALATLENLTSLNLSQNERITNRGAAALAALTNLKALNLSNTRVNASALRFFSGLLKLQSLALYGCRGIDDSERLTKLQENLPNLKCLRLDNAAEHDGMMLTDGSSDEESEDAGSLLDLVRTSYTLDQMEE